MDTFKIALPTSIRDGKTNYATPKLIELGDIADLTQVVSVNVN